MIESILDSTKKILGIAPDYTEFDHDIITHINTVFSTLYQLGVGPSTGFMILDNTETWVDLLGGALPLNQVQTYVFLRVRMLFDPPTTSYLISAMEKQIQELEWRISVEMEKTIWVDPDPTTLDATV